MQSVSPPRILRPLLILISTAVVLVLVGTVWAVAAFVTRDTRQDIDLAEFTNEHRDGYIFEALEGVHDETHRLCADIDGCIQGYSGDRADFRKFATREAASDFAATTPETYLSNWIVIEYTDASLDDADRSRAEAYVDSLAVSD